LAGDDPVRLGCNLSAANTPNWAVKELETRINVFTRANGTFRILSVIRPEVWCTSFQAEVHRKEACEEHNLAAKPHNRAD